MVAAPVDQKSRTTNQNFTIDIDQLYKDWITPIDEIRSYANPNLSRTMKELLGTNNTTTTGFIKLVKIESTVQESRCHAFYRWVGFPVVDYSNQTFYNPGFDIVSCAKQHLSLYKKLLIATNPIKDFDKLSRAREDFVKDNLKTFSSRKSVNAAVLALSSGGTESLRPFGSPYQKNSTSFDMEKLNQAYNVDTTGTIGKNKIPLNKYVDSGGNQIDPASFIGVAVKKHIIKPFIVDPRIEFSVSPQSRLIAVPFVPDDAHLKASSTESVRRPLIEKIIRDRQPINAPITEAAGTNAGKIKSYIDQVPIIVETDLINQTAEKLFKQNDIDQFLNSINIMVAMISKLISAENVIKFAQGYYYWFPYPNKIGPEGGSDIPSVFGLNFIDPTGSSLLVTPEDREILTSIMTGSTNNVNPDIVSISGIKPPPDAAYGTSALNNISSTVTAGAGDNNAKNTEDLDKSRIRILTKASEALRTIEIIMGEFSGLGLCDIIAITGALKIMPLGNLYGLLDDEAWERAKISLNINTPISTTGTGDKVEQRQDFIPSMEALNALVKDHYNIMDSIYQDAKLQAILRS